MTSSIRPPGGPGSGAPTALDDETPGQGAVGEGQATGKTQSAQETEGAGSVDEAVDPFDVEGAQTASGNHDADVLVARALDSDLARALSLDARQELASFLSETLAEDPTLQALLALQRGK